MSGKFVTGAIVIALCLALLCPFAGLAQQVPGGTPEEQVVTSWVKNILERGCPAAQQPANQAKEPFPPDIQLLLDAWLRYSKFWRYVYYVVSVGTILFGALATVLADGTEWYRRPKTAAALIATVLAGVNTTLSPYSEHKKFDDAFVVLNTTKLAYITNPTVTLCDVGKSVLYGEEIIHKGG